MRSGEDVQKEEEWLRSLAEKSQDSFDKTVLSLSGGALAISLTFLNNLFPYSVPAFGVLLYAAWLAWTLSLIGILATHFYRTRSLRLAAYSVQRKSELGTRTSWTYGRVAQLANTAGGVLFIIGLTLFATFVALNSH